MSLINRIVLIVSFFTFFSFPSTVLTQAVFSNYEDTLVGLSKEIQAGKDDFIRFNASERFSTVLFRALQLQSSFQYPFDSLKSISRLVSPDDRIRIFTWAIRKNDGGFDYAGILQLNEIKGKPGRLYRLEDHTMDIQNPENQVLSCDNWYGALYYRLLENEYKGHLYYTLLGWDGNSAISRRKLIEVLTVQSNGKIVFGAPIFARFPRKVKRVIFEYGSSASMSLNYSTQAFEVKLKKGKKKIIKRERSEMIVFDRLVPLNKELEGQFQFYVPETNIQDGFIWENGRWNFLKEVDARNPEKIGPGIPRKTVEFDLFPPKTNEKK